VHKLRGKYKHLYTTSVDEGRRQMREEQHEREVERGGGRP
jgi:hypothetical protein